MFDVPCIAGFFSITGGKGMRQILAQLVALLALVSFLSISAAIAFSGKAGEIFDAILRGIGEIFHAIGMGFVILSGTALVFASLYAGIFLIKKWKEQDTQIVRDGKDGQIARAVVYKGTVVQIGSAEGLGLSDLMQMQSQLVGQQQKTMQVVSSASTAIQRLVPLLEEYEDEDTVDERPKIEGPKEDYLNISEDYKPHADEFLSARKLIVGTSGSGKSNSTGTACEELGRLNVPMILADTENEYEPLCDPRWLPHGVLADRRMVGVENAADFGRYVLEQNLQVILNLQSYGLEEGALVMVNLIAGLRGWQEARANERRIPFEFLLEEATTWLPQNVKESPLYGTEAMNELQNAFFNDMVRKGRKRGLGLTVICQKIAEIDKRALQCEVKLLHRQTELIDLEKYAKMGITNEETLNLQNGEGYFFSSKVSKMLVQVRRRHSPHGANTPGLSELKRHQQGTRNFDERSENFGVERNSFVQAVEPFRGNISEFRKPVNNGSNQIPETTKDAILGLYRSGTKRTDIQGQLDLNGDEYWMVKAVCDEYDRVREVK